MSTKPAKRAAMSLDVRQLASRGRLAMEIVLWRHGTAWWFLVLMACVALAWSFSAHVRLQAEASSLRARIAWLNDPAKPKAEPRGPTDSASDGLDTLRQALGAQGRCALIDTAAAVANIADRQGLAWDRSEYRESIDRATGTVRVQFQLSFKAPYPKARRLVQDLLRALPCVSLDELSVHREGVEQALPETRLTLSSWRVGQSSSTGKTSP
jgi:hypothetical protein